LVAFGNVLAYDVDTRTEQWRSLSNSEGSVAPVLTRDEQTLYVPHMNGRLVTLDVMTGEERWKTDAALGNFQWAPASSGDYLYVAGSRGFVALHR
jgi:outer membrane protein assembly factor BamB